MDFFPHTLMTDESSYYPLAIGNQWHYRLKDGTTYTNSVFSIQDQDCVLLNSMTNTTSTVRKEGTIYLTDAFEKDNFQILLKDSSYLGETWNIHFKANGLENILTMTVLETEKQYNIEGVTHDNVIVIEAESNMKMNGTLMPLNFRTQYYYARSIGLILTTSSHNDYQALTNYSLVS